MTAIKTVYKGQETKPLVRYQVQARPEMTRLVVEFEESQHELLRRFMDLLVQTQDQKHGGDAGYILEVANNDRNSLEDNPDNSKACTSNVA